MIFNSYQFLFAYLPVVLAGTFLLARIGAGAARLWLIAASLFFYAAWNASCLPLLLGSIGFNYLLAAVMVRTGNPRLRTALLWLAVAADLGLLGFYKYAGFFIETLNAAAGTGYPWQTLILPLGISFYTFQQLTLLADISSGGVTQIRCRDFLLFVIFFPHLIAGPIVHHSEMMPQFRSADYRLNAENLAVGFVLLAVGLFKKAVLADGIAGYVTPVFNAAAAGNPIAPSFAWAAAIGFALQMYFDFSGYSEMALGLARMVGIRLPMNFNSPLKALSVIDYWSRWHITLTRFLTAYLYTPIAMAMARRRAAQGKRGLAGERTTGGAFLGIVALPVMTTMILSGLWHGAGNQYLVFGALHGAALVVNHAWRILRPRVWPDTPHYHRTTKPAAWALTFLVAIVALTYFHAASVAAGNAIVMAMAGLHGTRPPDGIVSPGGDPAASLAFAGWIAVLLFIALVPPNTLEIMRPWQPAATLPADAPIGRIDLWRGPRLHLSLSPRWALATAAMMAIGVLSLNRASEFLYWQF